MGNAHAGRARPALRVSRRAGLRAGGDPRAGPRVSRRALCRSDLSGTARRGADSGYEVVVATDGTSTINEEWQNAGINFALQNIADRLSCAEIIQALS